MSRSMMQVFVKGSKEALELYTKGVEISKSCDELLADARQKVEMGKMQLEGNRNDME